MGYDPGKIDGIYGMNTTAAVALFQSVAKLEVTGEATKETLEILYSPDCPMNPAVLPTQAPTEAPSETPTEAPSEVPSETPTEAPTEAPTDTPSDSPATSTDL